MSISIIKMIPAAILIAAGVLIMVIQVRGIFKLRYVLNRIHAAAMGDSMGILLIILGLMILYGFSLASAKLACILLLFWCASPVCSHLIGRLETTVNDELEKECALPEDGHFSRAKEMDK